VGEFRWTGFDYIGEADYVVGGWPYRMFHTGAVDTALFEKDMYYLYQSMWSDEPMLHILPSWTHPNIKKGTEIPIWVYSNCHTVELFLNGRLVGRQTRGDVNKRSDLEIQFDFYLPYEEGELIAVGYTEGKELVRERLVTASAPARIVLENEDELPTDPRYVGKVRVKITDSDGNFYPYGENRIYFATVGEAYVKALDNGSPTDVESHVNGNRNAFMGLCRAFVSPTGEGGDALLTAGAILGEKRQLTSNTVSIDVKSVALRGDPVLPNFSIFYTLDGSLPTRESERYVEAFPVSLGTTVRAAVYTDGEDDPMLLMSESFGENEGMYWELGERRDGGQRRAVVTINASCTDGLCIGADGLRAVCRIQDGSDREKWQMITDADGLISFINMENGGALTTNGSALLIGQNGLFDTGKWLRVGEAEHYDYLVHAATGKVIALSESGLTMADKRSFNDADMLSSPAFWDIRGTEQ
jgi:beta-galactosidase